MAKLKRRKIKERINNEKSDKFCKKYCAKFIEMILLKCGREIPQEREN